MNPKLTQGFRRIAVQCVAGIAALALLTFVAFHLHANEPVAALIYFSFIILYSLWADLASAIFISTLAVLTFDFFFTPPIFAIDFSLSDTIDIVAWLSFVGAAIIITRLVSGLRRRAAYTKV